MSDEVVGWLVITTLCVVFFGLLFLRDHMKRRSRHTLTEYQRGAFFQKGKFVREVGAGVHRVLLGRDYIVYGDIRPISFNFEQQTVALRDGAFAQYSFYATAEIRSFKAALSTARDYSEVPYYIVRRELREAIFAQDSRTVGIKRLSIESAARERMGAQLQTAGFELKDFKLTDLHVSKSGPDSAEHDSIPQIVN